MESEALRAVKNGKGPLTEQEFLLLSALVHRMEEHANAALPKYNEPPPEPGLPVALANAAEFLTELATTLPFLLGTEPFGPYGLCHNEEVAHITPEEQGDNFYCRTWNGGYELERNTPAAPQWAYFRVANTWSER